MFQLKIPWWYPNPSTIKVGIEKLQFDQNMIDTFNGYYTGLYPERAIPFEMSVLMRNKDSYTDFYAMNVRSLTHDISEYKVDAFGLILYYENSCTLKDMLDAKKPVEECGEKFRNLVLCDVRIDNRIVFSNFSDVNGILVPHGICIVPDYAELPQLEYIHQCGSR